MTRIRTGIVIGTYNMPAMIELQLRCIRDRCGDDVPIVISDDCSTGMQPTADPTTPFGQLVRLVSTERNCFLWPNVERIGHAGGDMTAFWKAILWGGMVGLEVVFKLSHRFVIDRPGWDQESARLLLDSRLATLGRECAFHRFELRTEAVGMDVKRWHRPDILAHLTPRKIGWPTESVIWDDVRDRLDGRLCEWPLLAPARPHPAPDVLFREANSPAAYASLAKRLGLNMETEAFDCLDSRSMPGYLAG